MSRGIIEVDTSEDFEKVEPMTQLHDEYYFYMRLLRVLKKNNDNRRIVTYVSNVLNSIVYDYDKII